MPFLHLLERPLYAFLLAVFLTGLDQISKMTLVAIGYPVQHNFGILFSLPVPTPISLALTVVVLAGGAWLSVREGLWAHLTLRIGMIFIAAGGLGNAVDRLRLGYVIDFIRVGWWPTFNLADVWICLGVTLILWANFFSSISPSDDLIAEIKKGRRY